MECAAHLGTAWISLSAAGSARAIYYADFVCHHPKLVIEIDGLSHTSPDYDARRDAFMRAQGYRVLRVGNDHVLREIQGVMILVQHELGLKD